MKVFYVFADHQAEMNCSVHNCMVPSDAINRTGIHSSQYIHIDQFIQNNKETQDAINQSDIVIVERNLFGDALTIMQFWKVRNIPIATIFDDAYHIMHPKNISYDFWMNARLKGKDENGNEMWGEIKPPPLEQLKWGLAMSKGLQTVSQALADDWKDVTDTFVIHNNIVSERYIDVKPLYPHEGIIIGWTGSLSHVDSFESSGLLRAFRKICKNFPKVKILISGDKRIFDLLDVPSDKKLFSPFVPSDKYPALIKTLDICTIPLFGEYDKRRSWIKPLECCALKVPWIATNFPNYAELGEYGVVTENGWQNWEYQISEMIEHLPEHRERAAEEPYKFALSQDIDLHVQERIDLYQHMIDKPYR